MRHDLTSEALQSALADYRGSVLDELQVGAARWAIIALGGGTASVLVGAMTVFNPVAPSFFAVIVALLVLASAAAVVQSHDSRKAAVLLVVGLIVVFAVTLQAGPVAIVASWAPIVVLTAVVVLRLRAGAVVALVVVGILLLGPKSLSGETVEPTTINAILLCFASLLVSGLTAQPFRKVLSWTWSSYLQALERTTEARERQGELARLSKSLSESYYRLEQLNLELERARQAAQKAQKHKALFAAAVSHELRTPLNLIIGFCEMMVLSPESAYGHRLPASYRSDVEAIYRNSCHISNLIDDILDLSQLDAGRMALHREWTALRQVVDETVATVETLFRDRELILQVDLPRDLPALFVDRTRVRQILINWLANAARFTEQGGVTMRARRQPDSIVVSVTDTGPGIPPEEQTLLFEEFHQVGGMRWQKGGSGLGLAVSRRFAELHGGTTWVESTLGVGSTFFLKLPLSVVDEVGGTETGVDWNDRVASRVRGQAQPRVLVIDDSGYVRKIFERYLDGYEVVDVDEFRASRAKGRRLPIHAVVLGASDALEQWKALSASARELDDAILVTCPFHTPRRLAEDLGVSDYLVKPITRKQLQAALLQLGRPVESALVVDDNADMNRLLVRMVESLSPSCHVWSADSGQQAIELLRANRPDVVLLDLLLPLVDGYTVLQTARTDPNLCTVPMIVVTAQGLRDDGIVAGSLSLSRLGGLSVAEVMQWLKMGLDVRLRSGKSDPAPRGEIVA